MKKTNVYRREDQKLVEVAITSDNKPEVGEELTQKWQTIINLIATLVDIPASLLMRITDTHMEVFLRSSNEGNPYPEDGCDKLGHGLYCESVIANDGPLLVENALENDCWKDNPDVKLNMISYLGLPIKWPDNEFFGTICVLDSKLNAYNKVYTQLLEEFRNAIEQDLRLLVKQQELTYFAEMDDLTKTYNRRKTELLAKNEYLRSTRSQAPYSVVFLDLNGFKQINDRYGHAFGDDVLIHFASAIKQRIRQTDVFGRWGGDEFVLICPNTGAKETEALLNSLKTEVTQKIKELVKEASFSWGYSIFSSEDQSFDEVIKRADHQMYLQKATHRAKR